MKKLVSLAMAVAVGAAMPALAMDKDHHKGHMTKSDDLFSEMDKNGDNLINQTEHKAFTSNMFKEMDTNNDRLLTREEIHDHYRKMKKDHAHWEDNRYQHMSPSAGNFERGSSFGSRSDRLYDSYKDTGEVDTMYKGSGSSSMDRPYKKH